MQPPAEVIREKKEGADWLRFLWTKAPGLQWSWQLRNHQTCVTDEIFLRPMCLVDRRCQYAQVFVYFCMNKSHCNRAMVGFLQKEKMTKWRVDNNVKTLSFDTLKSSLTFTTTTTTFCSWLKFLTVKNWNFSFSRICDTFSWP